MNKAVKRIFLVVSIVAVLACLAVGALLIFFPAESPLLSTLFTRSDTPDNFPDVNGRQVEKVEQFYQQLSAPANPASAPSAGSAAPSASAAAPGTYHLTEDEINQQIQYELNRRKLSDRGVEMIHARLTPGKIELVCRLNGDTFHNSLPPEQRDSFPALLRTRGTLHVWLVPAVDIVNRPWVQIEALQMGRIPVPVSLVMPLLRKNLKGVEYDPDYGFRLPEKIRRLEVADRKVDVELKV
jgi:hypothetical protein